MSEFSLIYTHFQNATPRHNNTLLGIGDDCAISHIPPDCELVSCVDMLISGRHFPHDTHPYAIGYKSVAVNLSDLAAMGATPYAILLGVSLPDNDEVWIGEFTRGLAEICRMFHVELIGGDTTKSDTLTISVTALGFVKKGQAIQRSGAKIGDIICVSDDIGSASFALKNTLENKDCELKNTLDMPIPQVELGQKLLGYANSMIDISDGLGQDLGHILASSGVGAKLDLDKIPCHALLNDLPFAQKYQHILNGGDDYQLCFTMSKEKFDEFNLHFPNRIFAIGEIIHSDELALYFNHKKVEFEIKGWAHF